MGDVGYGIRDTGCEMRDAGHGRPCTKRKRGWPIDSCGYEMWHLMLLRKGKNHGVTEGELTAIWRKKSVLHTLLRFLLWATVGRIWRELAGWSQRRRAIQTNAAKSVQHSSGPLLRVSATPWFILFFQISNIVGILDSISHPRKEMLPVGEAQQ